MKSNPLRRFALAFVLLAAGSAGNASAQFLEIADRSPDSGVPTAPADLAAEAEAPMAEAESLAVASEAFAATDFAADARAVEADPVSLTTDSGCAAALEGRIPCEARRKCDCKNATLGEWWKADPTRKFALGLNGAAGDTETLDLVANYDAKRAWGLHSTFTDIDYFYSRADVATTKNRLYWLSRYELAIDGTPWSWFADGWLEYDQFKPFDARIAFHGGLIRTIIKSDRQLLRAMAGLGAAKTFGGVDEDWKPEPQFGVLYNLNIDARQKLYFQALYYPELVDPRQFRLNFKAGWETSISDSRDLAFRISAYNRYDNTDTTIVNPNAIDYAMSIVWGF